MDIVVTIPKSEKTNNLKEREFQRANPNAFGFRSFANRPRKLNVGDRVYFVFDGLVRYSKEVFNIIDKKDSPIDFNMICEVTGREYEGNCLVLFHKERDESSLGVRINGFQGFRYKWWKKE